MIPKSKFIFQIIGRSGCGKSTLFRELQKDAADLTLPDFVRNSQSFLYPYTTRPPRPEEESKPIEESGYHFVSDEEFDRLVSGKDPAITVVEHREYPVFQENGEPATWKYATILNPQDSIFKNDDSVEICYYTNSLDGYLKSYQTIDLMTNYKTFGIYLQLDPATLLYRCIDRELQKPSDKQNFKEVMRRFYGEQYQNYYGTIYERLDTRPIDCRTFDNGISTINLNLFQKPYPEDMKPVLITFYQKVYDIIDAFYRNI